MAVGPRLFPYILGGAMLLSAALLFILPPRKPAPAKTEQIAAEHTDAATVQGVADAGEEEALEWRRVLALIALTALYVLAFEPAGFVIATAPFIVIAARVLGSRHWLRDMAVGVAVAGGIYYIFTQLLRVGLPGFPFGGL